MKKDFTFVMKQIRGLNCYLLQELLIYDQAGEVQACAKYTDCERGAGDDYGSGNADGI